MTPDKFNLISIRMQSSLSGIALWLCLIMLASLISACGGSGGGSSSSIPAGNNTLAPSAADQQIFEATLRPHLIDPVNGCVGCHSDLVNQDPKFAATNSTTAYNILISQQKVNLINPGLSRLYLRPKADRHNCGGAANCDRIAADFLAAIEDWSAQAAANGPPSGGEALASAVSSFALAMGGGSARADDNAIALFRFAEGSGDVTLDTSGVDPAITLQLQGMEWVDGGGLRNVSGKAQASEADSRKLFDMIAAGNEYSVEAWVIPENTAQDGPARIVSYSQDTGVRNFTMGQNSIYYQLRNRSAGTGANGTPALEALDPQTDTVLQHVVTTFDAASGRKVYIDGQLSIEENAGDQLAWQDNGQFLVLGNEVTDNRLWQGVFKLVAIHNKALSSDEVQQNFLAGTDGAVTMRFDVSEIIGQTAYIDMQAAQLDASGYMFAKPVFVGGANGIAVKNIRIGVNGNVPVAAQPFRRIDTVVNQSGTELSPLGAVIPAELGSDDDRFHLEFEVLGNQFGLAELTPPSSPPAPPADVPEPVHGLRTFSQINDTMSSLTGVDANQATVLASYTELRDSLPTTPGLLSFGSAQQIAIQRLATAYCGEVVNDAGACDGFFGACAVDGNAKDQVAGVLYDRFIGDDIANQPDRADVTTEIVRTIDDLGCANGCTDAAARTVLQASCSAVLSSGAVMLN